MGTQNEKERADRVADTGDWLEVAGLPGRTGRRGQVIEVLGRPGHEHYRVQWDDEHESVFFPTEAAHIVRRGRSSHRPPPPPAR
jgi:hypothetical protein